MLDLLMRWQERTPQICQIFLLFFFLSVFFFNCFTHTIYNATLTLPTLHTLIKILTYIVSLQCLTFTDLVLFKFVKKTNHFHYIYCYTYITFHYFRHTHTYIHVPVNYPTLRLEALHLSNTFLILVQINFSKRLTKVILNLLKLFSPHHKEE